jgi:hypothetical protein
MRLAATIRNCHRTPMRLRAGRGLNCGQQGPETEEDTMNPAIIQAIAAERIRDQHAHAVACRRAAQVRRSRRAQRSQPVVSARRDGRGPWVRRALRAA